MKRLFVTTSILVGLLLAGCNSGDSGHSHGEGSDHSHGQEAQTEQPSAQDQEEHGHPHPGEDESQTEEDGQHSHNGQTYTDHENNNETSSQAAVVESEGAGAVTHWTNETELFMEYPEIIVGQEATFAVHLTRLSDFAPLSNSTVTFALESSEGAQLSVTENEVQVPGIYGPDLTFEEAGRYDLTIMISGMVNDTLQVNGIPVYNSSDAIPETQTEEDPNLITFLKEQQWDIPFATQEAQQRTLTQTVDATGEIMAAQNSQAVVSAPFSGIVLSSQNGNLPVVGQHLSKGASMAVLNPAIQSGGGDNYAQQLTDQRHTNKSKHRRFTDDLKAQARRWLTQEKLSPELISGRWQVLGIDGVSHETLYQWIWEAKLTGDSQDKNLYKDLKHGAGKRRRGNPQDSRGRITGRTCITERPEVVEERSRLGDIEVDLMVGKAHKSALLVLTDRTTLLTKLKKVTSRKAGSMATHITSQLSGIPSGFIKTLTFDNDKAFANHQKIAKQLEADTYFTRPYTSQDKGTVENRIWVIRRFFPKGTDLRKVSTERIKTVEEYLNFRPIRKFDYLNPIQQSLKHRAVALIT